LSRARSLIELVRMSVYVRLMRASSAACVVEVPLSARRDRRRVRGTSPYFARDLAPWEYWGHGAPAAGAPASKKGQPPAIDQTFCPLSGGNVEFPSLQTNRSSQVG